MEQMISLPPLGLSEKWEFRHMPKGTDVKVEERCQWRELGSRQRQVVQVTSGHQGEEEALAALRFPGPPETVAMETQASWSPLL